MSISPLELFNHLYKNNIKFFTGVPDSLLKDFCLCIEENIKEKNHIIAANEGNAVAIATGYHLSTGSLPLVYMQNSGFGNALNPLISLCDPDVYSIPMLLAIGWRGEPGVLDEPQHVKQGTAQISLFEAINMPYEIIAAEDKGNYKSKINELIEKAIYKNIPVALLIKKHTFEKYNTTHKIEESVLMLREEALYNILDSIKDGSIIVSTTGKTSREIFEIRKKYSQSHKMDFLNIGGMGHSSSIALGIAKSKPDRDVICIDGDGSLFMHMGSLAVIASQRPMNFKYILINNKVHESVGGQDTAAKYIDIFSVADAFDSYRCFKVEKNEELVNSMNEFLECTGPAFMEVLVRPGSRKDLGRPSISPKKSKLDFMNYVKQKK